MARQSLGRGLSALLGDERPESAGSVHEVSIDQVIANPEQPRTRFAEEALNDLAKSISSNGIVQPLVVRKRGEKYELVAGERRWRAAQRAGLQRVPVVVREVADDKMLEIALIENIQRQDLNPVEEARAFRKLIDNIGLTQEMVADRVGKDRTLIATSLRLLKLPPEVQEMIEAAQISAGHGRALLLASDPEVQKRIARTAASMSLSVRETERMAKRGGRPETGGGKKGASAASRDANLIAAEAKLRRRLATNVSIQPARSGNGGKVEIEYYSMDDLDRIYETIMQD